MYVYLEYSVSGTWSQKEFAIYANGVKVSSKWITLNDQNRSCNTKFQYESNSYFVIKEYQQILVLEIKVSGTNLGLYLKNIVVLQRIQSALVQPLSFQDKIPICSAGWFNQYFCECYPLIFQTNQCLAGCQANYVYDTLMNECYQMNHCSNCQGTTTVVSCDYGYYELDGTDAKSSSCLARCPNDSYQDESQKKCIDLQSYLSTNLNSGYPVHHFFFIKTISDFMHYFNYQTINIQISSNPSKQQERLYFYQDNQFYVDYNTFSKCQGFITQQSLKDIVQQSCEQKQINTEVNQDEKPLAQQQEVIEKEEEQQVLQEVHEQQQVEQTDDQKVNNQQTIKEKLKAMMEYLKFFHQILEIIYKDDEDNPRSLRASIIYTSIMGSLTVLFLFNQPSNLTFTVALALITAPLNKIYQVVLQKTFSHKKKAVRVIGAIFLIITTGCISYIMLAGLVLSGSVETANQWSYIFIGTFSMDNLLYSPLQLVFQYGIHMGLFNLPRIKAILEKILDQKAKELLKRILKKK